MSKLARALALAAMLAAMNLAGLTAVAHAYPLDPASQRHRALGQLESLAAIDHPITAQQSSSDATARRLLARERSSIPNVAPAEAPVANPVRSAEPGGQPGWLTPALSVLAAVLALVAGVAVMAAPAGQPRPTRRPDGLITEESTMRRTLLIIVAVAALAATGWAARAATTHPTPATPAADPTIGSSALTAQLARDRLAATDSSTLAAQLARARLATGKYALNLAAAKHDGYRIITRMIPDMGWHFLNPTIQGFDITKPPILVYQRHRHAWQLSALEWVFLQTPATPPLPGATYGSFGAACHYRDGTFVFAGAKDQCATRSPQTGAPFSFWHPNLVTLHVWVWYHNPDGLYNGTNPLIRPFNRG